MLRGEGRVGRAGRALTPAPFDMPSQAEPAPLRGLGAAGPRAGLSFTLQFRPRVFMALIEESWNNPLKTVLLEVPPWRQ